VNKVVQQALVELFKAVADVSDGAGGRLPKIVRDAYNEAWEKPEVKEFYGQLVDERSAEIFGPDWGM
jgi:hypothetical protein